MTFRGWPPAALDFYAGLEADNSKAYWTAHKDVYERDLVAPMRALSAEVADRYGELHIFRPYRDVRFSTDKTPYKTAIGAVTESERGALFYVQLSANGLFAASGYHMMARDQVERFRAALDQTRSGNALVRIVDALRADGFDLGGETLKTAPRGFPRDHPRIALLRHTGLTAGRAFPVRRWLSTPAARDHILEVWEAARPLNAWLERHVGPSTLPPPEPR